MKGSSLKNFIAIVVVLAVLVFGYVALNAEIKRISREKILKHELLSEKQNRIEAKLVDIQKLTSEDRIVKMAVDTFFMVRPKEKLEVITVSKEQIKQIEKILNEKYD